MLHLDTNINDFLKVISVANFDAASADAYGLIRLRLRQKGRPTGEVDALIAAVAIANSATLVTHNTGHFEHIEQLRIADWL